MKNPEKRTICRCSVKASQLSSAGLSATTRVIAAATPPAAVSFSRAGHDTPGQRSATHSGRVPAYNPVYFVAPAIAARPNDDRSRFGHPF